MKYIVLETSTDSSVKKCVPIIFPDFMVHEDVFNCIRHILQEQHRLNCSIKSAGSINLRVRECYGKSETLYVESGKEADTEMINSYDYLHGIVY